MLPGVGCCWRPAPLTVCWRRPLAQTARTWGPSRAPPSAQCVAVGAQGVMTICSARLNPNPQASFSSTPEINCAPPTTWSPKSASLAVGAAPGWPGGPDSSTVAGHTFLHSASQFGRACMGARLAGDCCTPQFIPALVKLWLGAAALPALPACQLPHIAQPLTSHCDRGTMIAGTMLAYTTPACWAAPVDHKWLPGVQVLQRARNVTRPMQRLQLAVARRPGRGLPAAQQLRKRRTLQVYMPSTPSTGVLEG